MLMRKSLLLTTKSELLTRKSLLLTSRSEMLMSKSLFLMSKSDYYKPEFLGKVAQLEANQNRTDPTFVCHPPGLPRVGAAHKIVHGAGEIGIVYSDVTAISGALFLRMGARTTKTLIRLILATRWALGRRHARH